MNNKLIIFWIEDNPIQSNVERKNGKQYPKFLHEEFISYCLFQHPKQVEEYLSMINVIKNTTPAWAEMCQNALPDIVVFDYKMADAFKNNQHALSYYDNDHNTYLQAKSVSRKIKDTFENQFKNLILFLDRKDVKEFEYGGDEFKEEIKATDIQLDDEFGLYCGIAIVREFKEYITVGVPATINKADKAGTMSYNSLFYEWINSYDLKGALDRPSNAEEMKDWSRILNFSTGLLRNRIEAQLRSKKITPNLSQLLKYAKEIPAVQKDRIFTFQSAYGVRHLPLDGLFIDEPTDSRDKRIYEWVIKLLKNYKSDAYETAKAVSETLINTHKNTTLINNRIRLSELVVKLVNSEILSDSEKIDLGNLKTEFNISDVDIYKAMRNKPTDIKNKFNEYRKHKSDNNETNRLIVLFTDLQLHWIWQKFCEMNNTATDEIGILTLLGSQPTLDDLITALYPVPINPIILPYHSHLLPDASEFMNKKKQPFDTWEQPIGAKMGKDAIFSRSDYPNNLSEGEVVLCKSFCLDLELKENYFPKWLTKKLNNDS